MLCLAITVAGGLAVATAIRHAGSARQNRARLEQACIAAREDQQQLLQALLQKDELLARLEGQRHDLLAVASHDLRQPVHALGVLIDAWDPNDSVDGHRQRIQRVQARVELLGEMLHNLLDISRLDRGLVRMNETRFILQDLLQETFDTHADAAARKGLGYRINLRVSRVAAMTDQVLLARAIGNLLGNAIKFTSSGFVELMAEWGPGGSMLIHVTDTGIGIPPDRHHDIFMPYTRLDAVPNSEQGLGIGLSVVQQVASLLGLGTCLSSQPGVGTRISLHLPASMLMCAADVTDAAHPVSGWGDLGGGRRVLVVEDDAVILSATLDMLLVRGFEVRGATSVDEALRWIVLNEFHPDLLMTDLQLVEAGDGIQGWRAVRAALKKPDLPVVIVSGNLDFKVAPDEEGRDHIRLLYKPVRPAQIFEAIAQSLSARSDN
ncbi:ATP-binding response regulator [Leptothrix sp. BB-4]